MNIVKISGSVGEQMFQYAFFMRLLKDNPGTLLDAPNDWIARMFPSLPAKPLATSAQVHAIHKSIKGTLAGLLSGNKRTGNDYKEQDNDYKPELLTPDCDTYYDGSWLSYRYFDSIAKEVSKAFTVKPEKLSKGSQSLIKVLEKEKESVSIHVYRPRSKQNTCTKDYYNWAITHIRNFIEDPFFVVITDDVKWVEENLLLNKDEHICISAAQHHHFSIIQLFNHAKHNIKANTLESWWAAWLNPNLDKIVIAPQKWSHTGNYPHLIPLHWISVPTT